VQHQLAKTQQQLDRYAMELQRHGMESVEAEVRWLSELINAERHGEQSPDDAPAPEPTAATEPAAATAVSPGGAPVGNAKTRTGKTRKTTDKPRR
jgi:hypothetical protein